MGRREDNAKKAVELMKDQKLIRNLGTAAHIDHGKTTFSDNLIAGAGMMSSETAGEQRLLDYDEQEAARGITINAASAAMVVPYREPGSNKVDHYLVNLIDTPGHVDFNYEVSRSTECTSFAVRSRESCPRPRLSSGRHSRRGSGPCCSSTRSTGPSSSSSSPLR